MESKLQTGRRAKPKVEPEEIEIQNGNKVTIKCGTKIKIKSTIGIGTRNSTVIRIKSGTRIVIYWDRDRVGSKTKAKPRSTSRVPANRLAQSYPPPFEILEAILMSAFPTDIALIYDSDADHLKNIRSQPQSRSRFRFRLHLQLFSWFHL
ncbi:hypothetical protein EVAR_48064_1 [Eumeta japonica]|uniref:Uncharacterized protein n=1 Tax=Eumeta variegata TaxID=151549 RepID=A0A4C1X5P7_EUMVA|nr:hypothetical protein EVAR_48064_1 [Eumeta japonica]